MRNARIDLGLHGHLVAVGATLSVVDKVVRGRTTSWACLELAVVSCIASCRVHGRLLQLVYRIAVALVPLEYSALAGVPCLDRAVDFRRHT